MKYLYLFAFCLLSFSCLAQKNYSLLLDEHYSSMAAGEGLLTAHKVASDALFEVLPAKLTAEATRKQRNLGRMYRAVKFLFLEATLSHLTIISQHEIFGNGARFRQLGFQENTYHIELFPPYGDGGGFTTWGELTPVDRVITDQEWALTFMGGMEANRVMASRLQRKWLSSERIDFRETFLWLEAFQDMTGRIQFSSGRGNGDVARYLNLVNGFYQEEVIEIKDLKWLVAVNWLNPFQWMVFKNGFVNYWWNGNEETNIWMIPIGNMKYLPILRTGLSPFGGELQFENFIKYNDRVFNLTYRQGILAGASNWGLRIGGTQLLKNDWLQVDGYLDVWQQPEILIGRERAIERFEKGIGGSAQIEGFISSFFSEKLRFHTLILYKSVGYLEGEELDEAWRVAIGLNFDI